MKNSILTLVMFCFVGSIIGQNNAIDKYFDQYKYLPWNGTGWNSSCLWRDLVFGDMEIENGEKIIDEDFVFLPEGMYFLKLGEGVVKKVLISNH